MDKERTEVTAQNRHLDGVIDYYKFQAICSNIIHSIGTLVEFTQDEKVVAHELNNQLDLWWMSDRETPLHEQSGVRENFTLIMKLWSELAKRDL
mgnify:CR=1 FL=1